MPGQGRGRCDPAGSLYVWTVRIAKERVPERDEAVRRPPRSYVSAPVWPSGDWLPSGGGKCMTELDGWFGLATHQFPAERMPKHQCRSVKKLAIQADPPPGCRASVLRVSNHRVADRREMGPDLVRAPRFEPHAQERGTRKPLQHLEMGDRVAGA